MKSRAVILARQYLKMRLKEARRLYLESSHPYFAEDLVRGALARSNPILDIYYMHGDHSIGATKFLVHALMREGDRSRGSSPRTPTLLDDGEDGGPLRSAGL